MGVAASSVNGDGSGDFSLTSAIFTDVTGASITIVTAARRVKLGFVCVWANNNGTSANNFTFSADGVQQGAGTAGLWRLQNPPANLLQGCSMTFMTAVLTAGSHTFTVRVSSSVGTLLIKNAAGGAVWNFWAEECPT